MKKSEFGDCARENCGTITIWMDGPLHSSKYAPLQKVGFTTGERQGDVLTTYTAHGSRLPAAQRRAQHGPCYE